MRKKKWVSEIDQLGFECSQNLSGVQRQNTLSEFCKPVAEYFPGLTQGPDQDWFDLLCAAVPERGNKISLSGQEALFAASRFPFFIPKLWSWPRVFSDLESFAKTCSGRIDSNLLSPAEAHPEINFTLREFLADCFGARDKDFALVNCGDLHYAFTKPEFLNGLCLANKLILSFNWNYEYYGPLEAVRIMGFLLSNPFLSLIKQQAQKRRSQNWARRNDPEPSVLVIVSPESIPFRSSFSFCKLPSGTAQLNGEIQSFRQDGLPQIQRFKDTELLKYLLGFHLSHFSCLDDFADHRQIPRSVWVRF